MWIMITIDDNALDITYNWMLYDVIFVSLYGMSYENWVVPLSFHSIWGRIFKPIDSFELPSYCHIIFQWHVTRNLIYGVAEDVRGPYLTLPSSMSSDIF